ncbi:MAG TPA: rod shape-determining protein MreC [Mycobacteriales bacterium]|nr:rod shape-determining protein MreC [Mycobacteriales bacterium]
MRDNRRARVILAMLLLTAFTLITLDYRSGGGGPLRRIGNAVFGPVETAAADVARPIGSFFASLGHLSSYKHDNDKLRKQLQAAQEQNRLHANQDAQFKDMERLLHLDQVAQFRIVAAHVIGVGSSLQFESTATIDAGSADGIRKDQTVINGDGLVGRTISVGPYTSTVLLGNDPTFSAGARLESSQEAGSVDGHGLRPMTFELLNGQGEISVGDRLVTYGDIRNSPFVPEVPIGHVTSVQPPNGTLTRTATIAPYVRFSALDVVGVVVGVGTPPKRDSLLPPSPSPTPSAPPSSPPASRSASPAVSPSSSASTRKH